MKITAVVVTFNRLALLKECIAGLRRQTVRLQEIVVVNNGSSDGTDGWLAGQEGLTIVTQGNLGGSGGQYTGIQKAMEGGADWMWLMDDDAEPYPDALEQLLPFLDPDSVAAAACSVIDGAGQLSLVHRGEYDYRQLAIEYGCRPAPAAEYSRTSVEVGYATFVGIIVNRKAAEKVGLPKKELFLHFDDIEYSLRLKKYGSILLVPQSRMLHKENASTHFFTKTVLGRKRVRVKYEKLWLRYFVIRNVVWGVKEYHGKKWDTPLILANYYFRSLFGILLFDDHKWRRIVFLTSAFRDGLSARFENSYDYINGRTGLYS
jgi:rhamnopyranosyl-N-acetylglucosaminyl-diphospho-decaprenol beta-1,3/1,4-galactofuranosyltransferase